MQRVLVCAAVALAIMCFGVVRADQGATARSVGISNKGYLAVSLTIGPDGSFQKAVLVLPQSGETKPVSGVPTFTVPALPSQVSSDDEAKNRLRSALSPILDQVRTVLKSYVDGKDLVMGIFTAVYSFKKGGSTGQVVYQMTLFRGGAVKTSGYVVVEVKDKLILYTYVSKQAAEILEKAGLPTADLFTTGPGFLRADLYDITGQTLLAHLYRIDTKGAYDPVETALPDSECEKPPCTEEDMEASVEKIIDDHVVQDMDHNNAVGAILFYTEPIDFKYDEEGYPYLDMKIAQRVLDCRQAKVTDLGNGHGVGSCVFTTVVDYNYTVQSVVYQYYINNPPKDGSSYNYDLINFGEVWGNVTGVEKSFSTNLDVDFDVKTGWAVYEYRSEDCGGPVDGHYVLEYKGVTNREPNCLYWWPMRVPACKAEDGNFYAPGGMECTISDGTKEYLRNRIVDPFGSGRLIDIFNDAVNELPPTYYGELPPVIYYEPTSTLLQGSQGNGKAPFPTTPSSTGEIPPVTFYWMSPGDVVEGIARHCEWHEDYVTGEGWWEGYCLDVWHMEEGKFCFSVRGADCSDLPPPNSD